MIKWNILILSALILICLICVFVLGFQQGYYTAYDMVWDICLNLKLN